MSGIWGVKGNHLNKKKTAKIIKNKNKSFFRAIFFLNYPIKQVQTFQHQKKLDNNFSKFENKKL